MLGHNRQTYKPLVRTLLTQGFAVVAPDLRGHGESTERLNGTKVSFKNFNEYDWGKLPADVRTLIQDIQGFRGLDGKRITLVGASIGANTAALVGGEDNRVRAIVLLSPGLDFRGLKPLDAMKRFQRPAYILAGLDDGYSANSSRQLAESSGNTAKLELFEVAGHGTDMFNSHPELASKIALWIKSVLK
jgi:pimeloyl-ACP methyl ester carboxylesterase